MVTNVVTLTSGVNVYRKGRLPGVVISHNIPWLSALTNRF